MQGRGHRCFDKVVEEDPVRYVPDGGEMVAVASARAPIARQIVERGKLDT
jgi:hypothetical protein